MKPLPHAEVLGKAGPRSARDGATAPSAFHRPFDWLFRSRVDGRITIGQWPNLSLWLFFAAWIGAAFAGRESRLGAILGHLATALLAWWAADELLRGVNPWRRMLGAAVLGYIALTVLRA